MAGSVKQVRSGATWTTSSSWGCGEMTASSFDLHGVARTLAITLRIRAEEHDRPDALFRDPLAADWYTRLPAFPDLEAWYRPVFQVGGAIRATTFDRWLLESLLSDSTAAVLELGCGLSTRYTRLGAVASAVPRWIELDLPAVIALRRQFEAETDHHRFVAASLMDEDWDLSVPVERERPLVVIAEGVLSFLTPDAVAHLFRRVARRWPVAIVIFDVSGPRVSPELRLNFEANHSPLRWLATGDDLVALGLTPFQSMPVTHLHPDRWRSVGVDPDGVDPQATGWLIAARLSSV